LVDLRNNIFRERLEQAILFNLSVVFDVEDVLLTGGGVNHGDPSFYPLPPPPFYRAKMGEEKSPLPLAAFYRVRMGEAKRPPSRLPHFIGRRWGRRKDPPPACRILQSENGGGEEPPPACPILQGEDGGGEWHPSRQQKHPLPPPPFYKAKMGEEKKPPSHLHHFIGKKWGRR
jgi:hypothetical protein